jgi:hypothetical protein
VLLAVVGLVALYGVGLVIVGLFIGDQAFDRLGFGPRDGDIVDGRPRDYLRLVYGVLGAAIAGWMVAIGAIIVGPLRRRETWAWWAIVSSVSTWFVLDTGLSLVLGFIGHALFNGVFAVALAVPLLAIRRELR